MYANEKAPDGYTVNKDGQYIMNCTLLLDEYSTSINSDCIMQGATG